MSGVLVSEILVLGVPVSRVLVLGMLVLVVLALSSAREYTHNHLESRKWGHLPWAGGYSARIGSHMYIGVYMHTEVHV